jgi:hypothetical protein
MSPKRSNPSSITSMGFPLLQNPSEMCGQTDQGSWILLERAHVKWRNEFTVPVHCSRLSYVAQVGYRWYTLSSNGATGDGRGWTGQSGNRRILFRSHFFMKYPMHFLQHWYGTILPAQQDSIQVPTPVPHQGCCLKVLDSCIRWPHPSWPKFWTIHSHIQVQLWGDW